MDKLGQIKKALVATAAAAMLAATPVSDPKPFEPAPTENVQGVSVQILYRPVLQEQIPDAPKQRGDKAWRWWTEQLRRCKRGWVEPTTKRYICGYHYFYLNFIKIPRQDSETNAITGWDAPFYRDNDDEIMSQLWRNRAVQRPDGSVKSAVNHIQAKARTIGWTQMEFLGMDMYHLLFCAGRERYIGRGYPDTDNIEEERNWFKKLYAQMHPFLKTWGGKELKVIYDNDVEFSIGWEDNKTNIIHNKVIYAVIPDEKSAGVFKGIRCTKITAVEAGKWKGESLNNFYVENKDCLEAGDYKWGMMVIGGTSNAIINKSTNYKEMFYDPDKYNATTHFTPKTKALINFIDLHTGKSEVERALAFVLARRRLAEGGANYQKELVENPLTPAEAFTPAESFAYDQAKINTQINHVKTHGFDKMWIKVRLEYEHDVNGQRIPGRVKPVWDEEGKWMINKEGMPRAGFRGLHVAGIDDTYLGKQEGQKLKKRDSRNCMIIYRQPTTLISGKSDMPVAVYWDKAADMEETYNEFYKGMLFYDVHHTLYEFNQWGFVNWLKNIHESGRLWWINQTTPGIQVKGRVKAELTSLGYKYLAEDRHHNITNLDILESLLIWGSGMNTDYGSAFHLVLNLMHLMKDMPIEQEDMQDMYRHRQEDFVRLGHQNIKEREVQTQDRGPVRNNKSDFIRLGAKR